MDVVVVRHFVWDDFGGLHLYSKNLLSLCKMPVIRVRVRSSRDRGWDGGCLVKLGGSRSRCAAYPFWRVCWMNELQVQTSGPLRRLQLFRQNLLQR